MSEIRHDIQALRAVAVSAAVLFHAKVPGLSGGFFGVDVFFVISGYLITGLLLRELDETGRIDLARFWTRRAWRLLPNAIAVLLVCIVLVGTIGHAADLRPVSQDALAALLYVANYRFAWRSVDYFDDNAANSPVLHFWSLSVEEQFYAVWPLVLLGLWYAAANRRQWLLAGVGLVVAASFVAALLWLSQSLPDAFFRTEARIWQLGVGAIAAVISQYYRLAQGRLGPARVLGWLGVGLGLSGLHVHAGAQTVFAVVPTLATAVLLVSGSGSGERRLVSLPVVQWLGARSYSIYLWHWPVLVFSGAVGSAHPLAVPLAIVAIVGVSAVAYASIEQPLRLGSRADGRKRNGLLAAAAAGLAFVLIAGGSGQLGPVGRASALASQITQAVKDEPRLTRPDCAPDWHLDINATCLFGTRQAEHPRVVLVGDSFAQNLFDGLDEAARAAGWGLTVFFRASCPVMSSVVFNHTTGKPDVGCRDWNKAILRRLEILRPDLVVLTSWEGAFQRMVDSGGAVIADRGQAFEAWRSGVVSFLAKLDQLEIAYVVIPSTPRGRFAALESCTSGAGDNDCAMPRNLALRDSSLTLRALRSATTQHTRLVDLSDQFCSAHVCYSIRHGVIVYRDRSHHLTARFSLKLAPALAAILRDAGARK